MPGQAAPSSEPISASAVGEYVYCARAHGLRRVTATAPDPVAAALLAQGQAVHWRPGAALLLERREQARATLLHGGTRAHRRFHARLRLTHWLVGVGLLLIVMAVAAALWPLPAL